MNRDYCPGCGHAPHPSEGCYVTWIHYELNNTERRVRCLCRGGPVDDADASDWPLE